MLSYKLCRQDFDFLSKLINFLFSRAAAFLGKLKTRAQFYGKSNIHQTLNSFYCYQGMGYCLCCIIYCLVLYRPCLEKYRVSLKTGSLLLHLTGHVVSVYKKK